MLPLFRGTFWQLSRERSAEVKNGIDRNNLNTLLLGDGWSKSILYIFTTDLMQAYGNHNHHPLCYWVHRDRA